MCAWCIFVMDGRRCIAAKWKYATQNNQMDVYLNFESLLLSIGAFLCVRWIFVVQLNDDMPCQSNVNSSPNTNKNI